MEEVLGRIIPYQQFVPHEVYGPYEREHRCTAFLSCWIFYAFYAFAFSPFLQIGLSNGLCTDYRKRKTVHKVDGFVI